MSLLETHTTLMDFVSSAAHKVLSSLYNLSYQLFVLTILQISDLFIFFLNLLTPPLAADQNIPRPFSPEKPPPFNEHPFIYITCHLARILRPYYYPDWLKCWSTWDGLGNDGKWREVDADQAKKSSRGPCPGLNALANHGVINTSGREISFHQMASAISRAYNVSPIFALRATMGAASLFEGRKGINLSDLSVHGLIEHDASLLRPDIDLSMQKPLQTIQAYPHPDLIERFFPAAKSPLTPSDFSKAITIRREECAANNPTFQRSFKFDLIGSENCAILLAITGGHRDVVRKMTGIQGYECFDADWRPAGREAFGLTMVKAQFLLAWIELGTGCDYRPKIRKI